MAAFPACVTHALDPTALVPGHLYRQTDGWGRSVDAGCRIGSTVPPQIEWSVCRCWAPITLMGGRQQQQRPPLPTSDSPLMSRYVPLRPLPPYLKLPASHNRLGSIPGSGAAVPAARLLRPPPATEPALNCSPLSSYAKDARHADRGGRFEAEGVDTGVHDMQIRSFYADRGGRGG